MSFRGIWEKTFEYLKGIEKKMIAIQKNSISQGKKHAVNKPTITDLHLTSYGNKV